MDHYGFDNGIRRQWSMKNDRPCYIPSDSASSVHSHSKGCTVFISHTRVGRSNSYLRMAAGHQIFKSYAALNLVGNATTIGAMTEPKINPFPDCLSTCYFIIANNGVVVRPE
jgi:hypothetical protein